MPAAQDNAVRRFMRWTGSLKPISLIYARTLHHLDRQVFQLSGGRATFSAWAAGMPVVMLETTGAKSGRPRKLPVLAFAEGDDLFVVASNYGQDRHPAWYHNLKAHPRARVTVDGVTREVEAVEVTDPAERERLYDQAGRAVIVFPAYRKRTEAIGRRIPVVRLRTARDEATQGTPREEATQGTPRDEATQGTPREEAAQGNAQAVGTQPPVQDDSSPTHET